MPGLFQRLFGPRVVERDYHAGPKLAGLDALTERAIGLQKSYWRPDPEQLAELEGRGFAQLEWAEKLRTHHLRCLALLDANDDLLRRALLAPASERPPASEAKPDEVLLTKIAASAKSLLGRRSPYRPRHGFAWIGGAAPEGEDIPYSDFQGRVLNASLSHLGSLELIRLDEQLEPERLEFLPFDEILTISRGQLPEAALTPPPPFVPARILLEYGQPELVCLLPTRYGLSWLAHEPALLQGEAEHALVPVELGGLADPAKAVGNPHDRRPLSLRVGLQRAEILSDYAEEGLGAFTLGASYQLSLAIDQDDPRFVDKCVGRGLDPDATRGDVVRESRLRASARAAKKKRD